MKAPFTLAAAVALTLSSLLIAQTGAPSGGGSSGSTPNSGGMTGSSGGTSGSASPSGGTSGSVSPSGSGSSSGGTSGSISPSGSSISGSGGISRTGQESSPAEEQRDFVREAASGNTMEIQAGQFVAEHTQNPQVKQFAQTLVQDHQKAQQQLKQAAQQASVQITADEITPVHKAMIQELQQKNGKDLDRAFIFGAVGDHRKDILAYSYASQNLQNAQLKQYATQNLAVLQKHYQEAEDLARTVTGVRESPAASIQ